MENRVNLKDKKQGEGVKKKQCLRKFLMFFI